MFTFTWRGIKYVSLESPWLRLESPGLLRTHLSYVGVEVMMLLVGRGLYVECISGGPKNPGCFRK